LPVSKRASARHIGAALALAGGVGVVVGSALPWVGVGGVQRSAFTLARVANEMHVFERRSQRIAVYALLSTPALVPFGLVLLSLGWRRTSAAALVLCGLIGLVAGGAGSLASIGGGFGPIVTALGGVATLVGSFLLAVFARST
jgi:hypothetical protein